MRDYGAHERRWSSDGVKPPAQAEMSVVSSPVTDFTASSYSTPPSAGEEFVEVTLDIEDDDTIVLRSVEPATAATNLNVDSDGGSSVGGIEVQPVPTRTSSSRIRQFSQELKAEITKAKQSFSQQLTKRLSWNQRQIGKVLNSSPSLNRYESGVDPAIAARARRRHLAQLNRTRSGAHKALRGLRFISNKGSAAWNEVESNFEKLAKDGYLYRSDFAKCIGVFVIEFHLIRSIQLSPVRVRSLIVVLIVVRN